MVVSNSVQAPRHTLASLPATAAFVPGEVDAPDRRYLPIAVSHDWTERQLHCIHGMFMSAHEWSVAGFGGRTTDNETETETALRYPGWEVTYRLGFLGQLEQDLLLVFYNPTAETGDLDLVGGERGRFDQGQYAVFDTHRGGDVHLRSSAAATPRS